MTPDASTGAIWDLPTRLFHWLLAALIGLSWWTAETGRIEWHLWSGLGILTLVLFRLAWGLVGSSTARFSGFVRGPGTVLAYLRGTSNWRGPGHSPLGALSVIAMLGLIALQVGLGLVAVDEDGLNEGPLAHLLSIDQSDTARELHETLFNPLLALIALHIAAIAFYRLRGKRLVGPMIRGRGALDPGSAPMRPARWWVALLCLALALGITRWIAAGAPPFGP